MNVQDLNDEQKAALIEMVTECMVSGGFSLIEQLNRVTMAQRNNPHGTVGDVLRDVLGEFPADFIKIRPSVADDFLKTLET